VERRSHKASFRAGTGGACEASQYTFTGACRMGEEAVIRVAASNLEEALAYVRARHADLQIIRIDFVGMIRLISGSPVD
jgi:hypothetical protein